MSVQPTSENLGDLQASLSAACACTLAKLARLATLAASKRSMRFIIFSPLFLLRTT